RRVPPPPYLNNVAFPGADVLEVLNSNYGQPQPPASALDAYKLFLLGGRTELQRAREVLPTFVTVWVGNNDVLGAILDPVDAGSAADITPPATFATRYNALMDSIDSFGSVQGGVLLAVAQAARKWLYRDPNTLLQTLAQDPAQIRPFPAFPTSPPDPTSVIAPFGTAISRDGIHPSTSTQKLIAQSLQQAINAFYGSAIPAIP